MEARAITVQAENGIGYLDEKITMRTQGGMTYVDGESWHARFCNLRAAWDYLFFLRRWKGGYNARIH